MKTWRVWCILERGKALPLPPGLTDMCTQYSGSKDVGSLWRSNESNLGCQGRAERCYALDDGSRLQSKIEED